MEEDGFDAKLNGAIREASQLIANASALLILTGAGCSADSGLPVFNQVPDYLNLCNPNALANRRTEFHNFFLSALRRYEATPPHEGYAVLSKIVSSPRALSLVVTSNVDSALEKAGISALPIHGCVREWQCGGLCRKTVYELKEPYPESPQCPNCGAAARPAVLLFEDTKWAGNGRGEEIAAFLSSVRKLLTADASATFVVLEIGCGDRVPTLRSLGENFLARLAANGLAWQDPRAEELKPRARMIRINPDPVMAGIVRESANHLQPLLLSLPCNALTALKKR